MSLHCLGYLVSLQLYFFYNYSALSGGDILTKILAAMEQPALATQSQ